MKSSGLFVMVVAVSIGAHVGAYQALAAPEVKIEKKPALVEMTVAPKAREKVVEKVVEPEPVVEKVQRAERKVAAKAPAVAAKEEPPAASAPPPVDFTGTTLTGTGSGWASATGNGEAMRGPVGPAGPKRTSAPVVRDLPARGAGNGVVALANLSRPPRSPDLNARLEANYPARARQLGTSGRAVVRARIDADGRARVLRVVSESGTGFGEACQRTLDGSRWDAPLDRAGNPVVTELSYTCTFEVGG